MNKVLSVSIASYNVEKTIERTVNSILQAYDCIDAIEVIIVNDGSNDETVKIAKEYAAKYPNTVKLIDKSNGGYGSTINASLTIAKGKYYKLLDGDDTYVTENLSEFIRYLQECNADLVIAPYNKVYEKTGKVQLIDSHQPEIAGNKFENIVMHEITVRTDVLHKIETNITEHCFYTDNEFVFYALLGTSEIKKFCKPIYNYNLGVEGQSVSIDGIKKHYKDMIVVSDKVCTLFNEYILNNKPGKLQNKLLEDKIRVVVRNVYGSFLAMDGTKEKRNELREYDKKLRVRFPHAYRISASEKKISILRKTGFFTFGYLSKREKKRFV